MTGRREDLADFVRLFMLPSILLFILSTPFPSESAFLHFNVADPNTVSTVSDFKVLRDDTICSSGLQHAQGLDSIPFFFSTALAVLFCYALCRIPTLLPRAILLILTMVISTLTQGGNYLADVFGGLIPAVVTIRILHIANRERATRGNKFAPANEGRSVTCEPIQLNIVALVQQAQFANVVKKVK